MKAIHIIFKVLFGLLLVGPILGTLGIFPAPTADMYNTPEAFGFMMALMDTGYLTQLMALVFAGTLVLVIMNRMALAALLILPVTINIVSFHAFLDGGLFTAGALMGNILFLLNLYFLWKNCDTYKALLGKKG